MIENRFWRLNAHPKGNDFAAALSLEHETLGGCALGEVLIRADYLSMDAGTRMWMTPRVDGYQPPLALGSKMVGLVLGRVIESRAPGFAVGDLVRGFGQWADYSRVTPETSGLIKLDDSIADPRQHFGVLGMNAWTAYAGLVEVARVEPGETVLVSAAAGATGLLVCQIARALGCRVIALAGGAQKCAYLTDVIGVDRAIDYKNDDVAAALASVPGGINVYFDNVGGPILDAVLPNMAHYGRIAICGLIAGYDRDGPLPGPARFDQILMRRLSITGFFLPDFAERGPAYNQQLGAWLDAGAIHLPFDETRGLENLLSGYARLFDGRNLGKTIIALAP